METMPSNSSALIQVHFEQLKELRNGTISYIQIIKRDQIRPPVRPVCRKLGVCKLSEIKSETELLDALTSLSNSQSSKSKELDTDRSESSFVETSKLLKVQDNLITEQQNQNFSLQDAVNAKVFQPKSISHLQHQNTQHSTSTSSIPSLPVSNRFNSNYSNNVTPNITPRQSDSVAGVQNESLPEYKDLLECVLHIRIAWDPRDRSQRLDFFALKFGLDEKFLLNSLKRICELLGCIHLSPEIETDEVVNAVKTYYRQLCQSKKPNSLPTSAQQSFATANMTNDPLFLSKFGMKSFSQSEIHDTIDFSIHRPNNGIMQRDLYKTFNMSSSGRSNEMLHTTAPRINDNSAYSSARDLDNSLANGNMVSSNQTHTSSGKSFSASRSDTSSLDTSPRFVNEDINARVNTFSKQQNLGSWDYALSNPLVNSNNVYSLNKNVISTSVTPSASSSVLNSNNRMVFSMYDTFWQYAFSIMRSIVDADVKYSDTITLISNLNVFVSSNAHNSPVTVIALDSTIKVAFQELSGKVNKISGIGQLSTHTQKDSLVACVNVLSEMLNNSTYKQTHDLPLNFSSEVLLQNLFDLISPVKNDNVTDVDESLSQAFNDDNWLKTVEQTFQELRNEIFLSEDWVDVTEHIKSRLQSLLDVNIKGISIIEHGASITGLGNDQCTDLDLVIILNDLDIYETECLNSKKDITRRISIIENSLKKELQFDAAVKLLQSCMTDQRVHVKQIPSQHINHTMGNDGLSRIKTISKLTADTDIMLKCGDRFIDNIVLESQAIRTQPSLKVLLEQLKTLRIQLDEAIESIEIIKTQKLLNLSSSLSRFGYTNVRILKKNQDSVINFVDDDAPMKPMVCSITLDQQIYPYSSRLISSYYKLDPTCKVKLFAGIIRRFSKEHNLNDELSSYVWNILVIHFLLRFGYVCNIQNVDSTVRAIIKDIDISFAEGTVLPQAYQEKLMKTSVFELLVKFFKYFAFDADICGNVFTLRGQGDVIPKSGWSKFKPPLLWRFCIEDPFETGIVENPNDLGDSLTMSGQAKLLKTMSMAYFALNGLRQLKVSNINEGILDMISREKLYTLAMKGNISFSFDFSSISNGNNTKSNDLNISMEPAGLMSSDRNLTSKFDTSSLTTRFVDIDRDSMISNNSSNRNNVSMYSTSGLLGSDVDKTIHDNYYFSDSFENSTKTRNTVSSVPSINISGIMQQNQDNNHALGFKNNFSAVIQPKSSSIGMSIDSFDFNDPNTLLLDNPPPGLGLGQHFGGLGLDNFSKSLNIHDNDDSNQFSSW